jgi:hypothetical protein
MIDHLKLYYDETTNKIVCVSPIELEDFKNHQYIKTNLDIGLKLISGEKNINLFQISENEDGERYLEELTYEDPFHFSKYNDNVLYSIKQMNFDSFNFDEDEIPNVMVLLMGFQNEILVEFSIEHIPDNAYEYGFNLYVTKKNNPELLLTTLIIPKSELYNKRKFSFPFHITEDISIYTKRYFDTYLTLKY